jgi:peptidoglycan/LPS O-acetylase OafA/YrhL
MQNTCKPEHESNGAVDLTNSTTTSSQIGRSPGRANCKHGTTPKTVGENRIPSIDGLRALSIWAVLLGHASAHFSQTPLHTHVIRYATAMLSYFGVTVFFVISGFLITTLLLREHGRTAQIDLGKFYRRRAFRILPASVFYISIIMLFGHPSIRQSAVALTFTTTYFYNAAYLPLQHLWSLSVEEQFYMLWPLVFFTGPTNARRYCWVMMGVCPLIRLGLIHQGYAVYSHYAPAIADFLAAGCLLAFYQDRLKPLVTKWFVGAPSFLSLCCVTVGTAAVLYRTHFVLLWGVVPLLIALCTSAAIERRDRLLNSRALVWTGLLSYSLYLWQQPFLVFDGPLNILSVRLFLTFALAYFSYRIVEQPMLRFRARVATANEPSELDVRGLSKSRVS